MTDPISAGPELDAAVGKLMGLDVLGITLCSCEPECGEWEPTTRWSMARLGGSDRPVYLQNCSCDLAEEEDERILGHLQWCLAVVPFYSTEISDAWQVVLKLRSLQIDVMLFQGEHRQHRDGPIDPTDTQWQCALWWLEGNEQRETTQYADTAELAICRAALVAVEVNGDADAESTNA